MSDIPKNRILVVDDEPSICESVAMVLKTQGYEVSTAAEGFDALAKMRLAIPDLIISDLNMPHMSGFEFMTVVRHRFPSIPLIAMSGAFDSSASLPGMEADAFYRKGQSHPSDLFRMVVKLLADAATQTMNHDEQPATVQTPRKGSDSNAAPFILLTCTDCLRTFSLNVKEFGLQGIEEAPCPNCGTIVRYACDIAISADCLRVFRATPTGRLPAASWSAQGE